MKYIYFFTLAAMLLVNSVSYSMNAETDLLWACAKLSHVQKESTQDLHVIGLSQELQTRETKQALKTTLLQAANSGSVTMTTWDKTVTAIDLTEIMPLVTLVNKLQKEEEILRKQKLQKQFEQDFWIAVYGLSQMYGSHSVIKYYAQLKADKTIEQLGLKIPVLLNCN